MEDPPALTDLEAVVTSILGIAARLVGIAVFIMLIVGGFQYLTAMGDPKKVEGAMKTITGAIVGIALIIGGWLLIIILEQVTGVDLTTFSLCINPPCS